MLLANMKLWIVLLLKQSYDVSPGLLLLHLVLSVYAQIILFVGHLLLKLELHLKDSILKDDGPSIHEGPKYM